MCVYPPMFSVYVYVHLSIYVFMSVLGVYTCVSTQVFCTHMCTCVHQYFMYICAFMRLCIGVGRACVYARV